MTAAGHPPPPVAAPASGSDWATLTVATANLLNLARPDRVFYANQEAYSASEYARKIDWVGERIQALGADILTVQEVWDEVALRQAVHASRIRYATVVAPGAENTADGKGGGASGTPRVGLVTRLKLERLQSFVEFPAELAVQVPGVGTHARFERPPLLASLRTRQGQLLHVLTTHLKSKRPKFLQDADGRPSEDTGDAKVVALATLRSLIMRGTEAAALRCIVVDVLRHTREPLIVMGDFNDEPHSVTTQMVAATSEVAYDKSARDHVLFNAYAIQGEQALRRDVAYSHIHQGNPAVLDQILVSEEFDAGGKFAIGDVRRVDYFNDHLHEGRDRTRSDHGLVRAVLRLRLSSD